MDGRIIHVCISHQSDLGFYQGPIKLRLVYMDSFYEYLFWVQATAIFVLLQIRPYWAMFFLFFFVFYYYYLLDNIFLQTLT